MSEKHEFASPSWFQTLRATIERMVREAGPKMAGVQWAVCEVFTGVPEHLSTGSDRRIAWHCRIRDGAVEFDLTEIDDADFKVVADYETVLPLAHVHLGNDPKTLADVTETMTKAVMAGKMAIQGDQSSRPAPLEGLHDEMVGVTA